MHHIYFNTSQDMSMIKDNHVNLIVTSPPYFNAKDYSVDVESDLGNINDYKLWLSEIGKVWSECFRVLQPGRRLFINIMDLPVKTPKGFKLIPLKGDTVNLLMEIGFIFKQEIIWEKTNGVKSPFGSYPYPGGILLNNMHESILEFEKPAPSSYKKYAHLTDEIKEKSKLTKDDWIEIKKSNVWKMKPYKSRTREHLAPFPVELPERLIKGYSFVSETILDPFGGSGTTIIASENLGRNAIIFEINNNFEDIMVNKIKEHHPEISLEVHKKKQ